MQRDFHYYCIAVLARAAGFAKKDSLIIAYASQYVDDSTESEPIRVGELKFDPVRTAHIGLKAYDWSVQKRVYIPFHFIPPEPLIPPGPVSANHYSFLTESDSKFVRMVFTNAVKESNHLLRLCRIGTALHTFADTWSHNRFSGREHDENNVEKIYHYQTDKARWKHLFWENFSLDLLPEIGHAEAGHFPDKPFLKWKYTRKLFDQEVKRDNTQEFMIAARTIYNLLRKASGANAGIIQWKGIKTKILNLLSNDENDLDKRCTEWQKQFKHLFSPLKFKYDKYEWRNEALKPQRKADTKWDDFKPSDFRSLRFPRRRNFYNSRWVQFHRAALRQRHLVLENLP